MKRLFGGLALAVLLSVGGVQGCASSGVRTSIGVGYYGGHYGYSPYGYYGRGPVVVVPPGGIGGPGIEQPIAPPPQAVQMPEFNDYGPPSAGFDDFGGYDDFGGFDDF